MKKLLPTLAALLLLGSCTTTENAKKIAGHWRGASWLSNGQPTSQDPAAIEFTFAEDGNYSYVNGSVREHGLYRVDGDNLYTRPEGGQDIMVRIARAVPDTLVLDMNRAGTSETLTLVRIK
ncbi:lipocalin-like domain-containing protein [Flaviaesturariibacter terrae]